VGVCKRLGRCYWNEVIGNFVQGAINVADPRNAVENNTIVPQTEAQVAEVQMRFRHTRKWRCELFLLSGLWVATATVCSPAGGGSVMEKPLVSYCELFDNDLAMFHVGDETTPGIRNTEFIAGNEFLFARTGGWHPFAGTRHRSLTTLDCFCGSQEHPQSTQSLFAWPFVDGWGWGGCGEGVEVKDSPAISDALTIEAWIRPDDWVAGQVYPAIVAQRGRFAFCTVKRNNGLMFRLKDKGWKYMWSKANVLSPGTWQHVAVVYSDADNYVKFYVDGKLVQGLSCAHSLPEGSGPLWIGHDEYPSGFFCGAVDEVRLYNVALSDDTVKACFLAKKAAATAEPVVEFHFDEKTEAAAKDTSGKGNHGKVSGATWVEGKIGGALHFEHRAKRIVSYRCSSFYYSVNGGKYRLLDAARPANVRVSYVLGSGVVKAMVGAKECSFDLYTYAPPGLPAVCRYLVIKPKLPLKKLSLICYTNPVMPDGPVTTHQTGMRYGDAANDRVTYEHGGLSFSDAKYALCLRVASSQRPSGYGCRDISKVRDIQKYYRDLRHLRCETDASSAAGDVEAILRFDYTDLKAPQSLLFAYTVGHSPGRVKEVARDLVSSPRGSLDKTVAWWREWLGYHEPSCKAEALIQQGLISIKTMQASTGGISAGTTWSKCFNRDSFHLMQVFLLPYGSFAAHRRDAMHLFAFHEEASEKFGGTTTGGYDFALCDLSKGSDGSRIDICYLPMALRQYLKETGDVHTALKYLKRARKITKYMLSEAGDDHLMYLHVDSAWRHSWAGFLGKADPNKAVWPASFDDSLSLWYSLDFLESLLDRTNDDATHCREEMAAIMRAIDGILTSRDGLWGVIAPDGELMADITFRHLQHLWLGGIPETLWSDWLRRAQEKMLITVSAGGRKIECVITSPACRGRSSWGVAGYLALAALKAGDDALAAGAVRFMMNSASAHGTWAEGAGFSSTRGSLNFGWNTGPNIAGLFAYYIGLVPLERGYDKPFQIHPHDLDKILPIGKSFGAGKAFQITRLSDRTYRVKLPLLSGCSADRYALSASRPVFPGGKANMEASRESLIKGIDVDHLSNTRVVFTPM